MKQHYTPEAQQELAVLCNAVRKLVEQNEYQQAELLIKKAVGKYPGAPHPHNLLGLLLEARKDHLTAMKHFRAGMGIGPYLSSRTAKSRHLRKFLSKWKMGLRRGRLLTGEEG